MLDACHSPSSLQSHFVPRSAKCDSDTCRDPLTPAHIRRCSYARYAAAVRLADRRRLPRAHPIALLCCFALWFSCLPCTINLVFPVRLGHPRGKGNTPVRSVMAGLAAISTAPQNRVTRGHHVENTGAMQRLPRSAKCNDSIRSCRNVRDWCPHVPIEA
jgi:hypothetical protein